MGFGCSLFLLVVFTIAAVVIVRSSRRRSDHLQQEIDLLRADVATFRRRLIEVLERLRELESAVKREAPGAERAAEEPAPAQPAREEASPIASPAPPPPLPAAVAEVSAVAEETPEEEPVDVMTAAAREAETPATPSPDVPPPPPPAPPPVAAPQPFDWEGLIGVKLFSWIAGIALALAGVFFLRYSIEHGWLTPAIRMTLGLLTGIVLLIVCELKIASRYRVTANAFDGAGIALLYSTLYASYAIWGLVRAPVAFAMMILVTAVAVVLSIRRDSVFIALLGLVGGFSTPALLSRIDDQPVTLFTYLLILNAGLAWIAYRRKWPVLSLLSVIFTVIYQWIWVVRFLDQSRLPLAATIFLIFPVVTLAVHLLSTREKSADDRAPERLYEIAAALAAALPLLFAIYFAVIPGFGPRFTILFAMLAVLAAGLAVVSLFRPEMSLLHLLGGTTTLLVVVLWLAMTYRAAAAWPAAIYWIAGFSLFYAGAPFVAGRFLGRRFEGLADHTSLVGSLLLVAYPVLIGIEARAAKAWAIFVPLFAVLIALAIIAMREERGALFHVAGFFAIAAVAVWSSRFLTEERLETALLLYGALALYLIAVPTIARVRGRDFRPSGAGAALQFGAMLLLFFLAAGPVASLALWGMGILLAVVTAGLFMESAALRIPALAWAAGILSWLVIAFWWGTVIVETILIPALIVVTAFSILLVGLTIWMSRRLDEPHDGPMYLGLVGYLFLALVAFNPALSLPPWPLFAVTAVLAVAFVVAALYARKPVMHISSMAAAQVVVAIWIAPNHPWPTIGTAAAAAVIGIAVASIESARRAAPDLVRSFVHAAVAAAFGAQLVTIVASAAKGQPQLPAAIAAHAGVAALLLLLAAKLETHAIALLATVPASIGFVVWGIRAQWPEDLVLATAVYAVFAAYPIALGRRLGTHREPHIAAILASAAYFFFARRAIDAAGHDDVIGILPVAQAAVMGLLLWRLVKHEPQEGRVLGRLALVAGAALAFVTVAIPLQLDKEWITIGWALEGAALAWLFLRIPHRGLLAWSSVLLAVAFARLVLNPAVFVYYERSGIPILNWYLYTYLLCAAAMFAAARLIVRSTAGEDPLWKRVSGVLAAAGVVLLFALLNIEIADFYSTGQSIAFDFSASLAQDLSYTIGWALFAIALLSAGIVLRNRPARIASIALLSVTIFKCFLHDLARLGGLYRVASFIGLALALGAVAVMLQQFVLSSRGREEAAP